MYPAMNILHSQHNGNEPSVPSVLRQLISKTFSPPGPAVSQCFQTCPRPVSSARRSHYHHVTQHRLAGLIANTSFIRFLATSPIFESPDETNHQKQSPPIQISSSVSSNGRFVSDNLNLMSHTAVQQASYQDPNVNEWDVISSNSPSYQDPNLNLMSHTAVQLASYQDPNLNPMSHTAVQLANYQDPIVNEWDLISSNSPICAQTRTLTSSLSSLSLDEQTDNLGGLKLNDQKMTRSPVRTSLRRSSLLPQVWRKDIVFGSVIGKGGFGKVHSGHIHGRPVAIKVVQKRRGSGIHREILQAERLAFSLHLRHENIISILGLNLCDGLRGDALIVMELVSPRTLQSVLDDASETVTLHTRLKFALQISKGLNYLHKNDVVHLDVKPRNVLMTTDNTCKLGDFGSLTRTRKDVPREETEFTQLLGTLPYRAPELMRGCFPSNKADIFSLGITLWQLATRETPHCGANPHWLIYQVTKGNRRPTYHYTGRDDSMELRYCDLYIACWDAIPENRPSAEDVIVSLSNLQ